MLRVEGLTLAVPGFTLGPLDLCVQRGAYFVLVGPSGAGKTLLLESIAGLHRVQAGELHFGERRLTGLAAEARGLSMVYQDPLLFEHLDVAGNIGYALRVQGRDRASVRARVRELAELLGLSGLLGARVARLSGGEARRVALARALAAGSDLLLLDEPLTALDPPLQRQLRRELARLHRRLGLTVLHVTHSVGEARSLATDLGVLVDGQLRQVGPASELFEHPADARVAAALSVPNFVSGRVADGALQLPSGLRLPLAEATDGACRGLIRGLRLASGAGPGVLAGVCLGVEQDGFGALRALVEVEPGLVLEVPLETPNATGLDQPALVDFRAARLSRY